MNCLRSSMFVLICLFSSLYVYAEEDSHKNTEEDIDLALLEFLGDWETDDGDWIAPEELEESAYDIAQHETVVTNDE